MAEPFLYLGDNVTNASNLLQSMVDHGVKKFILSSTANLFDDPESMPIKETERIVPGSPYGESKYIIERMLHWMDEIYDMKYCCLRYFNAAGASDERGEDHTPEYPYYPDCSPGGAWSARVRHRLWRGLCYARWKLCSPTTSISRISRQRIFLRSKIWKKEAAGNTIWAMETASV